MSDLPDPVPAATLILMRDQPTGPPLLLMTQRAHRMAFAAGAWVFPGGRVDPGDRALARTIAPALADAAARIAAVRETIEEIGLAPAVVPPPMAEQLAEWRGALAAQGEFALLINQAGARLDLDQLTPFARWCPNFKETRRFDTFFFLAAAPDTVGPLLVDEAEAVHALWISAEDMLGEIAGGRADAIFPTRRNLERLARFNSLAEAIEDARRHPVQRITPWIEERGGERLLCIPNDAGYPVTSEPLETARRS